MGEIPFVFSVVSETIGKDHEARGGESDVENESPLRCGEIRMYRT